MRLLAWTEKIVLGAIPSWFDANEEPPKGHISTRAIVLAYETTLLSGIVSRPKDGVDAENNVPVRGAIY